MKKITFLLLICLVAFSTYAQRISNLTIEGATALTPLGAFNPTNNDAAKPGDGQIVYPQSVDLSNVTVTISAGVDASVVEPSPLPVNWTSTVKGVKVQNSPTAASKPNEWAIYDITIKKIIPASLPLEIKTGAANFSNSWTPETVGWAGAAIDKSQTLIRFGSAKRSFVVAFKEAPDSLYYTIKALGATWATSNNVFDVEGSADGLTWSSIFQYNSTNIMPVASPAVRSALKIDGKFRYIRWVYTTRNTGDGAFNVSLENILVTLGSESSVKNYYANNVKLNFGSSNSLQLESAFDVQSLRLIDITGHQVLKVENPGSEILLNNLNNGIYIGEIKLNNGHIVTKKLIRK
ncbi:hypothetical protein MASR2M117_11370 [Paludibacter sp.]